MPSTPNLADLPELREGDPLSARWLNALRRLVLRAQPVGLGTGLVGVAGPGGTVAQATRRSGEDRLVIRPTFSAGAGLYSWIAQEMTAGGGWRDGPDRGYAQADPARPAQAAPWPAVEASGLASASAIGKRLPALRDPATGRPVFVLAAGS